MIETLIYSVIILALIIASYTDIKTREVPDWLNYSLIATGIGTRAVFSLVHWDYSYLLEGLAGFGIFFLLSLLLFYTGLWGGGDSKILMGLGALIGIRFEFLPFLILFFIMLLLAGSVYGFAWSLVLALRNMKGFLKKFKEILKRKYVVFLRRLSLCIVILFIISLFFESDSQSRFFLTIMVFLVLFLVYLWAFSRAVEESCMHKLVSPEKLTEGDWIVNDVVIGKKRICGPKDLGIEKKQINELIRLKKKGKVRKILIKEGIPFVPTFLVAYILTLIFEHDIVFIIKSVF